MCTKSASRVLILLVAAVGCTAATDVGGVEPFSKDEAAASPKADWPRDYCADFGWYQDGICDAFCPSPDQDCGDVFCGGFLGSVCPDGQYCDYDEHPGQACGIADGGGVCRLAPTACRGELAPVCGCDGDTYSNACGAAGAGTDVAHDGPCERPSECTPGDDSTCPAGKRCMPGVCPMYCASDDPDCCPPAQCVDWDLPPPPPPSSDCRTTGCDARWYCSYCWGHFACIPDGALC